MLGCGGSGLLSRARETGSALPGDGVGQNLSKGGRLCGTFILSLSYSAVLEKEMATHSSVLAWRIPGTEEPSGLPSMGSHRVGHD